MSKRSQSKRSQIVPLNVFVASGRDPIHEAEPPKSLTEEEALDVLWSAKSVYQTDAEGQPILGEDKHPIPNPKWCNAFVYATLNCDVTMNYSTTDEVHRGIEKTRTAKKGTRVLVTMVSRLGDVGIRDDHLVPASNGYYARVGPEDLTDWNMAP